MEKDPKFVWSRVNEMNIKDVGNINFNIIDPQSIADPTHVNKASHNIFVSFVRNTNKDNPLGVHMYYVKHIKNYWEWYHNH